MSGVRGIGDWIGERFEVFDIHEGGMSTVYVAHDHLKTSGPAVVALKTLKDELISHRIRRSRFATECRLWVQLGRHPNIVQAHAVEILEGKPYVVLELVQGGDLIRWIGSPRLDLAQALRFGIQFCQGMEHAVRQGLSCHRDIKPGNLLITQDGVLKITDFGLARICEEMVAVRPELPDGSIPLAEAPRSPQRIIFTDPRDQPARPLGLLNPEPRGQGVAKSRAPSTPAGDQARSLRVQARPAAASPADASASQRRRTATTVDKEPSDFQGMPETADPRLTRSGARMGTGAYMAPEQFRDPASVDVRADIYAFGVVLFEMVTGRLPFKGRSLDMLDRQHSKYDPPSIIPLLPRGLSRVAEPVDQLVQRCLKKDPADRFRTMSELRKALQGLLSRVGGR
ncbi:MAG: serine/threonine-protein kinase [Isosphaeraceae bacterium]